MNVNLLRTLFILIVLIGSGCTKEKQDLSSLITGKWEWVKSVSSWTGTVSDPGSAGYRSEIEFTVDGKMNDYRNDTLILTSDYSLEPIQDETDKYSLWINSELRSVIYMEGESLVISTAFVDGPVSWYVRLK